MSEPITPVLFRKFSPRNGGDVIAIFPGELGTSDPAMCLSYLHIGQHGSCSPHYLMQITRRAFPDEYADLKRELESIGYRLRVISRMTSHFYYERRKMLEAMTA